ncbi:MarR family winged helix-turn-helix transcriptional regulator [Rhizohabitans arisaemae]|uniref:MarR family winged helix-turn-helix transcriptional regulator n=1 Tax=Rhizohabitans arisaemae TaxID=2720610 RepID=UPI0024B10191|nr:MarR family winged helix-turn-helix transcriptional regulator [Rhizohabitans arisaemae]
MNSKDVELAGNTGFLLTCASGMIVRMTNAHLAHLGLRVRHFSALSYVCDTGGASQREIADFLKLDPSPVVAIVDSLEADGLVERLPDPRDRRARQVAPTPQGRAVRDQGQADIVAAREVFLSGLAAHERELLLDMLQRLVFADAGGNRVDGEGGADA